MASKEAIARVVKEVFGTLPNRHVRTGNKFLKKPLIGAYLTQYYPEKIDSYARLTLPGYTTEIQARRLKKLELLRQRGKGPPKKGAGKRASKKK